MLQPDVEATMRSVAELIETVNDLQARKVCYLIADLLRRALEENERLRAQLDAQAAEIAQLRAENAELRAENAKLRAENAILKEQNAWLRRQLFGDKAEALPPPLAENGEKAETDTAPKETPAIVDEAKLAEAKALQKKARAMMREAHARAKKAAKKVAKGRITSELVRRRVPPGIICDKCLGEVKDKGMAHTASELDVIPACFLRREYLLHRGECDCGAVSFIMPGPERGLEKTTASASLIAECAVDKFLYHCVPRTRQLGRRCEADREMRDGPLAADDQDLAANRCMLLPLRAVVVSDARRTEKDSVSVRLEETSESEPSMKRRNSRDDAKTGSGGYPGISESGVLKPGSRGIRLEGGVNSRQALGRNVGTCRRNAKEKNQVGEPGKDRWTDVRHRGRATRSSDEGAESALEQRGSGILQRNAVNRLAGGAA